MACAEEQGNTVLGSPRSSGIQGALPQRSGVRQQARIEPEPSVTRQCLLSFQVWAMERQCERTAGAAFSLRDLDVCLGADDMPIQGTCAFSSKSQRDHPKFYHPAPTGTFNSLERDLQSTKYMRAEPREPTNARGQNELFFLDLQSSPIREGKPLWSDRLAFDPAPQLHVSGGELPELCLSLSTAAGRTCPGAVVRQGSSQKALTLPLTWSRCWYLPAHF